MQLSVCIAIATTGFWCRIFAQLSRPSCDSASIVSSLLHQKKKEKQFSHHSNMLSLSLHLLILSLISFGRWMRSFCYRWCCCLCWKWLQNLSCHSNAICTHFMHPSLFLSLFITQTNARTHIHTTFGFWLKSALKSSCFPSSASIAMGFNVTRAIHRKRIFSTF